MTRFPICIGGQKERAALNTFLNVVIVIMLALVIFEAFFNSRFVRVYVVGDSMSPTLTGASSVYVAGGDFVYVDRYATPERGDIIVISTDEKIIIKRLIAVGGDSVELRRGALYLNGEKTEENYVLPSNNINYEKNTYAEQYVPEGYIFFLGDNRDISNDSRSDDYGMMKSGAIIGVVTGWSMSLKGLITSVNTFFEFTIPGLFGGRV